MDERVAAMMSCLTLDGTLATPRRVRTKLGWQAEQQVENAAASWMIASVPIRVSWCLLQEPRSNNLALKARWRRCAKASRTRLCT